MTMAKLIQSLASAQAKADAREEGGYLPYTPAVTLEILDTQRDSAAGRTTAWFIFDFLVLRSAQSGSDMYFHYVLAGCATILDDRIVDSKLERLRNDYIPEHLIEQGPPGERYDRERVRNADRDVWWSKMQGILGRIP